MLFLYQMASGDATELPQKPSWFPNCWIVRFVGTSDHAVEGELLLNSGIDPAASDRHV
jgi:hypothetical protein